MSRPAERITTGSLLALAVVALALWRSADAENRILGGYQTTIEDVPFQLALEGGRWHICGGSILTRDWALTAAHCVYDQPIRWLSFRAGSSTRGKGGTVHPVKYYVYHDKYSGKKTLDYDIAVAYVRVPFDFKTGILPITLPITVPKPGELLTVSGWGYLEQQHLRKPKELMVTDIVVYRWDECKTMYPIVTPRMMCVGDIAKDICSGDSGGPLVRGFREQVGVVSWGYKCGDGLPSVYTNLSAVAPWIRATIGLDDFIFFPE